MKFAYPRLLLVAASLCSLLTATAQENTDSTGLPGDDFSLQGALQLFKQAASPEDFERLINTENNDVNNLDLNQDGNIDYVRVIDRSEGDVHVFVLQVPVSATESQDIAVIELEKRATAEAVIQITGDEDIFGTETIVEPDGGEKDAAMLIDDPNFRHGPAMNTFTGSNPRIIVNVWFWPSVRFIYAPAYRPWISPWRWQYYPRTWRPWRPMGWSAWYARPRLYRRAYVVVSTHRVIRAQTIYRPIRVSSVTVRTRHASAVGKYRVSRSRTTVTGPRGNRVTRKTTSIEGPRGRRIDRSRNRIRRHR